MINFEELDSMDPSLIKCDSLYNYHLILMYFWILNILKIINLYYNNLIFNKYILELKKKLSIKSN
jgi:hypothetical protein